MRRLLALCVLALSLFLTTRASAAFIVPPLTGFVVDPSHVLKDDDRSALDRELGTYRRGTGHHVAVLVTDSLGGESIEDVAYRTFNTWGLGDKQRDDGVLVVLAPTERRVRIEVGKGLGGKLTDLQASQIIESKIIPQMRGAHFYEAARDGTRAIEETLATPVSSATSTKAPVDVGTTRSTPPEVTVLWVVTISCVVFVVIAGVLGLAGRRGTRRRRRGDSAFSTYDPTLQHQHVHTTTTYDASSSFTSGGGYSGGSDFSGGGGSSGGGGASGSY